MLLFFRYEDEINKRTDCENNFVLIKKVCLSLHNPDKDVLKCQQCFEPTLSLFHMKVNEYSHYYNDLPYRMLMQPT